MFDFFTTRRRRKLASQPFPEEWKRYVHANIKHWCLLSQDERSRLEDIIKIFIAEKNWEGVGGLELTDEIKVTVSALACLLILELDHDFYKNVDSILIYPSTVILPERQLGFFEIPTAPVENNRHILGQAIQNGPVIIVWDATIYSSQNPGHGHNVVYHEFAHKLDMLDGMADGTPPLKTSAEYKEWIDICSAEYLRLRELSDIGEQSYLDAYGATNEAEFFAVATEQFFDEPISLLHYAPKLYDVLKKFYRQDPAKRIRMNFCYN